MTKDEILIGLLIIKARGGKEDDIKEYIAKLLNSFPGDTHAKTSRAAAAIMAYGSYERGLFDEELLAEMLEMIINDKERG